MIEIVHRPGSREADEVVATLRDMTVAFKLIEDPDVDGFLIRDGARHAERPDEVDAFLAELRSDLLLWNKYQSDTCYLDGEEGTC